MAIDSVTTLITELGQSRLLDSPQLDEVQRTLRPRFQDPRALARHLIERGWLTPYHINQLFQGRGQELVIGSYVILERVGEGGMGQVFKARHQKLNRIVALKVIRKEWLTQVEAVRRFQREIRAASQLTHPNIVHTFDASHLGETHYIAMEFIEGVDLARLVKNEGPLPVARACDYIRQAALGLQHAHEKGMVHRDIKPSNFLLTEIGNPRAGGPWGTVKILDMGLARIPRPVDNSESTASGTLTQAGSVVGTPDYISPEQARDARTVDIRSDLYSLGCTLFYLLTGQVPFPGGTGMEKIFKHQLDEPPAIRSLRADVPPAVAALVHRLLAKRPEDRYQIPADLAQALVPFSTRGSDEFTAVLTAVPAAQQIHRPTRTTREDITPPDSSLPSITPRRARRRLLGVASLAALLLLGCAVIGGVVLLRDPGQKVEATKPAPASQPTAPNLSPLERLDSSRIPAAERIPGLPGEVVAVLGEQRLRNWGSASVMALSPDGQLLAVAAGKWVRIWDVNTGQNTATVPGNQAWTSMVAFGPDGKTLQIGNGMNEPLRTVEIATGKTLSVRSLPEGTSTLALAPDGRTAVVSDKYGTPNGKTRIWDLLEDKERAVLASQPMALSYAYAPNGKFLLGWNRTNLSTGYECVIWDVADGKEKHRFKLEGKDVPYRAALSANGESVAVSLIRRVEVWNAAKGQRLFGNEIQSVVPVIGFSPDGQSLIVAGQSFDPGVGGSNEFVRLWNATTGEDRFSFPREFGLPSNAQFSPDGRLLVLGSINSRVILWDLVAGKERFPLTPGKKIGTGGLFFSADGRSLVSTNLYPDPGIFVWDIGEGSSRSLTTEPTFFSGAFSNPTLAPDRQTVLTRGTDTAEIWNVISGREIGRLPMPRTNSVIFGVSGDGKTLAYANFVDPPRLYDLPSMKLRCPLQGAPVLTHLIVSEDGQTVVGLEQRTKLHIWDGATGKERQTNFPALPNVAMSGTHLSLSRDGKHLAITYSSQIRLLNLETSEERLSATAPAGHLFYSAQFSPTGDQLLGQGFKETRVWDVVSRGERVVPKFATDLVQAVVWSPDGKRLAGIETDGKLTVWEAATGRELRRVQLPGAASQLAFAPDGIHLATGNANGTVYILRLNP